MRICLSRLAISFDRNRHNVFSIGILARGRSSNLPKYPLPLPCTNIAISYSTPSRAIHGQNVVEKEPAQENETAIVHTSSVFPTIPTRYSHTKAQTKIPTKVTGPKRADAEEWVKLTYPFLPPNFEHGAQERANSEAMPLRRDRKLLATILRNARAQNVDVLAYLGLKKNLWHSMMYLVRILLEDTYHNDEAEVSSQFLSNIDWPNRAASPSLRNLVSRAVDLNVPQFESSDEHENIASGSWKDGGKEAAIVQESDAALREVWQSLGSIVIEASDKNAEDMRSVMGWVYEVIARLHHDGMIPRRTYQFDKPDFTSSVCRSPIIGMLSTRILGALAITAFTKESREIPGEAYRLKGGDPFPNVWLEFILWCCIDKGFVEAGSWILQQLRASETWAKWKLVDWTSYKPNRRTKYGWISGGGEHEELQTFLDQTEDRSLSTQVVTATIDGLISNFRPNNEHQADSKLAFLPERLSKLLSMLRRQNQASDEATSLNRTLVRVLEAAGFSVQQIPSSAWQILHHIEWFRSTLEEESQDLTQLSTPLKLKLVISSTNPAPKILHQLLEHFARLGDHRRAVLTFDDTQLALDRSRMRNLDLFGQRLDSLEESNVSYLGAAAEGYFSPTETIPLRVLGCLLDIVTEDNALDFGNWLLYSADADGPVISPHHYGSPCLAPALVRFAQATGDRQLLSRVLNASEPKTSLALLHAVLNARLNLRQFDVAEQLLQYLRDNLKGSYGLIGGYRISNLATLAATILRYDTNENKEGYAAAVRLFERMLRGVYENKFNYSPHIETFKEHLLSSYLRVLESFPNPLQAMATRHRAILKPNTAVLLPAYVFNLLLAAVTEKNGAVEAKKLWDLHCQGPVDQMIEASQVSLEVEAQIEDEQSEDPSAERWRLSYRQSAWNSSLERFEEAIPLVEAESNLGKTPTVAPDIWTLRIIVRAALKEISSSYSSRSSSSLVTERGGVTPITNTDWHGRTVALQNILDWSVVVFKQFGLREYDINVEFGDSRPGSDYMNQSRVSKIYKRWTAPSSKMQ
ncbi:MAG: hypothetical protein Q9227_001782 [Pyrenula ochraceoflavens]